MKKLFRVPPRLSPNPPKDTDGRREESGRGVSQVDPIIRTAVSLK